MNYRAWFENGPHCKVSIDAGSGCWLWQRATDEKGYGRFGSRRLSNHHTGRAHRLAYELFVGRIPSGTCVLHKCDRPACCNPEHLFLGSRADNNADMQAKGRHRKGGSRTPVERCQYERGSRHHAAKLTEDAVRRIRARYAAGGCSQRSLGQEFGVRPGSIGKIIRRELWANI